MACVRAVYTRRLPVPSTPLRTRQPPDARDLLALAMIAAFFAVAWWLVDSRADVPVIDDWVYAWSVDHFLRTGELRVLPFSAIYPLAQVIWAAAFAKIWGFSFVTLRLSTVVLSIFGCWAVYLTLRELQCRRFTSLLGAFAVACDPVFFALSFSFMTDVPFVDLSAIAMYFFVSAIVRDQPRRLWFGGLFAILAFLVRPIGILIPLSGVPVLAIWRDWLAALRRVVLPIGVPVVVMILLEIGLPGALGSLDWAGIREKQLQWVLSISPLTYLVWTIRVMIETVFPIFPLLFAPLVGWRRASAMAALALLLVVPVQRARGEIPSPLPDWQTWSLQDIGARSVIGGDATPSPWSARVMPIVRGLGLLAVAGAMMALARGVASQPQGRRWPAGTSRFCCTDWGSSRRCTCCGCTTIAITWHWRRLSRSWPPRRSTGSARRSGSRPRCSWCWPPWRSPARVICWRSTRRAPRPRGNSKRRACRRTTSTPAIR